jgi:succinate dehydrogenase/fumarate reductase flavoprotein subunit
MDFGKRMHPDFLVIGAGVAGLRAATGRRWLESRGAHYRTDFPKKSAASRSIRSCRNSTACSSEAGRLRLLR